MRMVESFGSFEIIPDDLDPDSGVEAVASNVVVRVVEHDGSMVQKITPVETLFAHGGSSHAEAGGRAWGAELGELGAVWWWPLLRLMLLLAVIYVMYRVAWLMLRRTGDALLDSCGHRTVEVSAYRPRRKKRW